jgi:putative endonuclease
LKFYVYIIYSNSRNKYYIGSTGDLEDRLKRHNKGRSRYTKSGIPWVLVYTEEFTTRGEAIHREKQLKSWKNRKRLENLIRKSSK